MERVLFGMMGISYENAPIEIRELVAFTDTGKMELYGKLHEIGIEQAVILSTCNRSEIYFLYQTEGQIEEVIHLYACFFGDGRLRDSVFWKKEKDAMRYLYEVACGLKSLVLLEDQILGQVVQAEEFSRANGCSRKIMNHIFRDVITCAKKAKTDLGAGGHPLSLSYIGIKQLKTTCGIEGKEILVLGSGKMSALAMKYLYEADPGKVYNANRSRERAENLKKEFPELVPISFAERYEVLKHCDILIGATTSPHVIIKKEEMPAREKELFIVDLASPRDVDTALREKEHIHLYDMDYLRDLAEKNNQMRMEKAAGIAERMEEEIEGTMKWILTSRMDEAIRTLQERVEEVGEDAYKILEHKLTLSEHEKHILKKVLKASLKRLMREPIISLTQVDAERQEQYGEVVKELFSLEAE